MHVRVRISGKPDSLVVVESLLTKIEHFRKYVQGKFNVEPKRQRLLYGGKLLEDGCTLHDYSIKMNDVVQLIITEPIIEKNSNANNTSKKAITDEKKIVYKDAQSNFYVIGDLIDMRDPVNGSWLEGKIVGIVTDLILEEDNDENRNSENSKISGSSKETKDLGNKPSKHKGKEPEDKPKAGILKYFSNKKTITHKQSSDNPDDHLLFKIVLDAALEDEPLNICKFHNIRPRARKEVVMKDLKVGQKVMINHNIDEPLEKGYWYDFEVTEIKKNRKDDELVGTLYLGPTAVPQNDTTVKVHDKIFAIEEVVPLNQRNEDYNEMMVTPPPKRASPLNCLTCRDVESRACKDCGCYYCAGKNSPEKIILCDECHQGYHMFCLSPALMELPDDEWFCPFCKRHTEDIIAPGAAKQVKKVNPSKTKRDWGRGMACVGRTKSSAVASNHFGPIPGIEVGMRWRFRIQLSELGVHRPPVAGIHGRDTQGAFSIALSGGYEDDVDNGDEFTYTGSGGRNLSGNKRTAEQSCDQKLTSVNRALARSCAVKQISEEGADAGENWREGKPVRVIRSSKMLRHFPKYAPTEGIRYDGIYKVVKYYPEKGLSGYRVWKYLLRRDDPSPAPWEPDAKQYDVVYPDGFLEAQAEKKAREEAGRNPKKRPLQEMNQSFEINKEKDETLDEQEVKYDMPNKKRKLRNNKDNAEQLLVGAKISAEKKSENTNCGLSTSEKDMIKTDSLNYKQWEECVKVCEGKGKRDFIDHVTQVFLCIICQDVAASPVTTPCLHNFCMSCIKQAFKATGTKTCPACRQSLADYTPEPNENLQTVLRNFLPGYDIGK